MRHGWRKMILWSVSATALPPRKMDILKKFSISTPAGHYEGDEFVNSGGVMTSYCIGAREAADEIKARLVPLDAAFALEWQLRGAESKAGLLLTRDGVHMAPEGNRLIASTMLTAWKLA